jgi:transposase
MEIIGFDLHKRESQLAIKSADGTITDLRIATTRARLTQVFQPRPPARILLEASTESEWVAQLLESLGHEVIVADPNFAAMYATRSRRAKTDKRDARTLMQACELGAYRRAHRLSAARRHIRAQLAVRDTLVRSRTRCIALTKALVRRDGGRVPTSASRTVWRRVQALELSELLGAEVAPLLQVLVPLNEQIAVVDARLAALAVTEPVIQQLATMPQIGIVTAAAVVATVDDITRFATPHALEAYFGLVPSEDSSADRRRLGRITKAGNARVRWLLVEAAWRMMRTTKPETAALRTWALGIAARRGKRIAAVALARRLVGILYALWRDGVPYTATKLTPPAATRRRRAASPHAHAEVA